MPLHENRRSDPSKPAPPRPPAAARPEEAGDLAGAVCALAQIGGWEIDVAGGGSRWSAEIRRLLEVDAGDPLEPERLLDFCRPGTRAVFAAALAGAVRDGRGFDLEIPLVTARGRNVVVRALARVESRGGKPARVVGALQDITSRHTRDQARRRLELEVAQVAKAETLDTFAGGVAHDFNNLLTGIMGFHELIACDIGENPIVRDYLAQARGACLRARELLEQILTFARQTSAAPRTPLNLGAALEDVQRELQAMLPETVAVDLKAAAGLPLIHANAAQIRLALLNLALHVARTIESAGGTVFLGLQQAGRDDPAHAASAGPPPGGYACLTVGNTPGPGRPLVERRAFEQSFSIGEMTGGEGLDVAIVFRIVRAHHGTLALERDAEGGCEFRLCLPLEEPAAGSLPADLPPPAGGRGEMIFVVEDESTVATFMRHALERSGYRAITVESPAQCLAMLARAPAGCDLLVTEQGRSEMSGLELAKEVHKLAPRLPVLVATGKILEIPADLRDPERPVALLPKPFTAAELLAAVHRLLHAAPGSGG